MLSSEKKTFQEKQNVVERGEGLSLPGTAQAQTHSV